MNNLTKVRIEKLYSKLLIDPDFEKLELIRNQPNIFEILGVSYFEIRHSHFLAWLFDPKGSHGIGDYFLKRFLLDILQDNRSYLNVIDIHSLLNENIIIHREKHNIDILIEFENTLLVIENKINASESNNQLQKYKDSVLKNFANKKPIFVYLTKYGTEASLNQFYIEASYQKHILEYLNDLILLRSGTIQDHVLIYIKDYIDNLNNNVMQQSEANSLAEKIYRQHQELFDFIIANKPNEIDRFGELLTLFIKNKGYLIGSNEKGYVRFVTPTLNELLNNNNNNNNNTESKGWKNKELFLFEIFFNKRNTFYFKATTSPSSAPLKQVINNILKDMPDSSEDENNEWTTFINKNINRDRIQSILNLEDFEFNNTLEQLFAQISPYIQQMENKLLEKQAEIIMCKTESQT
ncbi:PD-(D/E)XK nuclease family protein [Empedobacter falsenii]